jgi:Domain of unknown function (DUF4351)
MLNVSIEQLENLNAVVLDFEAIVDLENWMA